MIPQHPISTWIWLVLAYTAVVLSQRACAQGDDEGPPKHCADWSGAECTWEPNLRTMTVDFGPVQETFYAYVTPDVSTFYNETPGRRKPVKPKLTSLYGKFVNLSNESIYIYYLSENKENNENPSCSIEPFGSGGLSTYPGHTFYATTASSSDEVARWTMQEGNSNYYYDPYGSTQAAMKALQGKELSLYQMQLQNRVFAEQYKKFTGNEWLALYKQKKPPRFHMWRADAIGQTFSVESKEIHFIEHPPEAELTRGMSIYGPRPDEVERMRRYRDVHPRLSLTLTALSCSPRVFEIRNFLSDIEVDHILDIASRKTLDRSTVSGGNSGNAKRFISNVRTSRHSWIPRSTDFITDTIYKRAADILQMNEALLRSRRKAEVPEFTESPISVAERLQLVHYNVGEQYNAHHDFAMPKLVNLQPSRFATILFYLNDDMEGGETSFPLWLNAETPEALMVKPEKGKAILFYSMLPDGNYDERSQHAAMPVLRGEKWLTNLWVWDPYLDHTVANHI